MFSSEEITVACDIFMYGCLINFANGRSAYGQSVRFSEKVMYFFTCFDIIDSICVNPWDMLYFLIERQDLNLKNKKICSNLKRFFFQFFRQI